LAVERELRDYYRGFLLDKLPIVLVLV